MEDIFIGVGSGLIGILTGWVLNGLLHRYLISASPLEVSPKRMRGKHKHEFTHNPGDGYFYCSAEGCTARKKLGGL